MGGCGVFDLAGDDFVTMPGGVRRGLSDCPEGTSLMPGETVTWHSDGGHEGGQHPDPRVARNGCEEKHICGVGYSHHGVGGGWQLCFL